MNGFEMSKDLFQLSKCWVCNRLFSTPQELFSHFDTFHSNHLSTFSSAVAAAAVPAAFHHYPNLNRNNNPNQNRNPNQVFSAMTRFDLNYYRRGYLDVQGRFLKGLAPAPMTPAKRSMVLSCQEKKKPRLVEYFPMTPESYDGGRTLPLIYKLEQQVPVETVTGNGGAISRSIDLTLRL